MPSINTQNTGRCAVYCEADCGSGIQTHTCPLQSAVKCCAGVALEMSLVPYCPGSSVECCVYHSDTNNWCYQPSTGDIQQHFHFFLRHFKVHFNFVKVAGPMTRQSSWCREWYFYFWALNLQNKYIVHTVHLSAEIMSLDRLSGAAAAVNETLDSHLLCCRPNPAPVQTQMVTWPPQRWRCSFHVTQTLES